MSDKTRIQVNVHLGQGQMDQLRILATHYGSISAAVRVALDALWREFVRSGQVGAAVRLILATGRPILATPLLVSRVVSPVGC